MKQIIKKIDNFIFLNQADEMSLKDKLQTIGAGFLGFVCFAEIYIGTIILSEILQ